MIAALVVAVAVAFAVLAVYDERHPFYSALHRMGPWPIFLSLGLGILGMGSTFPVWKEVLGGLGVDLTWQDSSRVFFVSQMGKYAPGSVWPVLMQMEAGRSRGASRRTMIGANLVAVVITCSTGLAISCVILPFHGRQALDRYWWALALLPCLLALLHPRALPALLDRIFAVLRQPPLHESLSGPSEVRASGWAVASWLLLGSHLGVLAVAAHGGGAGTLALCVGAMALAWPVGVLFIPAPAGAGVRDVVLCLVLSTSMPAGQALAIVICSRVMLIVCDVALAIGSAVLSGRSRRTTLPGDASSDLEADPSGQ
jgi:uncharacterized membrane protein YbhN (UPF0104 family)